MPSPPQPPSPTTPAYPGPPPDEEATLPCHGGVQLRVERFHPRGKPRYVAVFIHGFSSHGQLYRPLADALAADGGAVTLFDCRGHGRSEGRRGFIRGFDDYLCDLEAVVAWAREPFPQLPFALVGHSQGGLIALDYVLSNRGQTHALVLGTPWLGLRLKVPWWKLGLAPLLDKLWPTLAMNNELKGELVSRNPQVVAGFPLDPLVHHVSTPRWFCQALAAQRRVLERAGALQCPTLMLLSGQDHIVCCDTAMGFAAAAGPKVTVQAFDGLYHEIFLEPERDQVFTLMRSWLLERLGGALII